VVTGLELGWIKAPGTQLHERWAAGGWTSGRRRRNHDVDLDWRGAGLDLVMQAESGFCGARAVVANVPDLTLRGWIWARWAWFSGYWGGTRLDKGTRNITIAGLEAPHAPTPLGDPEAEIG
jgi:hypothetical protein